MSLGVVAVGISYEVVSVVGAVGGVCCVLGVGAFSGGVSRIVVAGTSVVALLTGSDSIVYEWF